MNNNSSLLVVKALWVWFGGLGGASVFWACTDVGSCSCSTSFFAANLSWMQPDRNTGQLEAQRFLGRRDKRYPIISSGQPLHQSLSNWNLGIMKSRYMLPAVSVTDSRLHITDQLHHALALISHTNEATVKASLCAKWISTEQSLLNGLI